MTNYKPLGIHTPIYALQACTQTSVIFQAMKGKRYSNNCSNFGGNASKKQKLKHDSFEEKRKTMQVNQIGIDQSSLSGKEVNLSESITANSAARSRIMDTDFAKEQSNSIRLQILQQTATAALSQANMGPQAVLGFLG